MAQGGIPHQLHLAAIIRERTAARHVSPVTDTGARPVLRHPTHDRGLS